MSNDIQIVVSKNEMDLLTTENEKQAILIKELQKNINELKKDGTDLKKRIKAQPKTFKGNILKFAGQNFGVNMFFDIVNNPRLDGKRKEYKNDLLDVYIFEDRIVAFSKDWSKLQSKGIYIKQGRDVFQNHNGYGIIELTGFDFINKVV